MKYFVALALITVMTACKKQSPVPEQPPLPEPDPEIITTFRLTLTDSSSGAAKTFIFSDPDGPGGGQPAYYGPSPALQSDSVITLKQYSTYYGSVILLNETTNPPDSISNEVKEEGDEHMIFYNNGSNLVTRAENPYTVKLAGSDIEIRYADLDNGTPQRGIGLLTRWRSNASTNAQKFRLTITLRHQEGSKDGTFAPGETDVEVGFRILVN